MAYLDDLFKLIEYQLINIYSDIMKNYNDPGILKGVLESIYIILEKGNLFEENLLVGLFEQFGIK